jgi:TfoX/Sxy family transcriptional regulator of competence genes
VTGATSPDDTSHAQERFDELVAAYLERPGVSLGQVFHNNVLLVNNQVFAMTVRGELVVKVSLDDAQAMIARGQAVAFEPRHDRPMKQWISIEPPDDRRGLRWEKLVEDAYRYVASLPPKRPRRKPKTP